MVIIYVVSAFLFVLVIIGLIPELGKWSSKTTSVTKNDIVTDYYFQIATEPLSWHNPRVTRLYFYLVKGSKFQYEIRDIIPIYKFDIVPLNLQTRVFDLIDEAFFRQNDKHFCPIVDREKTSKGVEFKYHNIAYVDALANNKDYKVNKQLEDAAILNVMNKIKEALLIAEQALTLKMERQVKFNIFYIYGFVVHRIN